MRCVGRAATRHHIDDLEIGERLDYREQHHDHGHGQEQRPGNVPEALPRLAPSIAAASLSSGLMVCNPASRLIAKNGTPRQILTMMIEIMARSGSPSQLIRPVIRPRW